MPRRAPLMLSLAFFKHVIHIVFRRCSINIVWWKPTSTFIAMVIGSLECPCGRLVRRQENDNEMEKKSSRSTKSLLFYAKNLFRDSGVSANNWKRISPPAAPFKIENWFSFFCCCCCCCLHSLYCCRWVPLPPSNHITSPSISSQSKRNYILQQNDRKKKKKNKKGRIEKKKKKTTKNQTRLSHQEFSNENACNVFDKSKSHRVRSLWSNWIHSTTETEEEKQSERNEQNDSETESERDVASTCVFDRRRVHAANLNED